MQKYRFGKLETKLPTELGVGMGAVEGGCKMKGLRPDTPVPVQLFIGSYALIFLM